MAQENVGADAVLGAVAGVAGGAIGAAVGLLHNATALLDSMSGPSTQKFEVNEDNILKAGALIQDSSERLRKKLNYVSNDLRIPSAEAADGKVGADIASAWNSRLVGGADTYEGRVTAYVKALDGLSEQLREAAKQYGFTEEEITTTFGPSK